MESKRNISKALSDIFLTVWRDALKHAKSRDSHHGLDGVFWEYAVHSRYSLPSVVNWSPDKGTRPHVLNEIFESLRKFVLKEAEQIDVFKAVEAYNKLAAQRKK